MREYGTETLTEITFLVLLSFMKPNHGYGVLQFLDEHTNGRIRPGAGTLYGVINTLCKRGDIELYAEDHRKKTYFITEKGKVLLEKEIARLECNVTLARKIMEGGSADEDGSIVF